MESLVVTGYFDAPKNSFDSNKMNGCRFVSIVQPGSQMHSFQWDFQEENMAEMCLYALLPVRIILNF